MQYSLLILFICLYIAKSITFLKDASIMLKSTDCPLRHLLKLAGLAKATILQARDLYFPLTGIRIIDAKSWFSLSKNKSAPV
jgi:hypothetical protein